MEARERTQGRRRIVQQILQQKKEGALARAGVSTSEEQTEQNTSDEKIQSCDKHRDFPYLI
jgi:hypothetical protein